MNLNDYVVYDIETFKHVFSIVIADFEKSTMNVFEISERKNDAERLRKYLAYLRKTGKSMVGFNNLSFDYPVLHRLIQSNFELTSHQLYDYASSLINSDNPYANRVYDNEMLIPQVDLYLINHYDNQARRTSLKAISFNLRRDTIDDLPFAPDADLSPNDIDKLIQYNIQDVLVTLDFFKQCESAIDLRKQLEEAWGLECTNLNDSKIGSNYFIKLLEEQDPEAVYYKDDNGKRKMKQTFRKQIAIKDVIFDYVKFTSPEFKAVLDWLNKQVIKETKGVFSDILESDLGDVAQYADMVEKEIKLKQYGMVQDKDELKQIRKQVRELKKEEVVNENEINRLVDLVSGRPLKSDVNGLLKQYPMGKVERRVLKSNKSAFYFKYKVCESLNVNFNGLNYVFGTGGLHASVSNQVVESDDEYQIVDVDVASYYPNLFIKNGVRPEHLGELFTSIYSKLYEMRKQYPKGSAENMALKLALNGSYGNTNSVYSPFYDPKATMAITVNGQLLLAMLAEKVVGELDATVIAANTDGITFKVNKKQVELFKGLVSDWESITGLEMEYAYYSKMFIRDVNNYIAVYENGKLKKKGAYECDVAHIHGSGLGHHQNQSEIIVKKAVVEYITTGVSVEQFIKRHDDKYDFLSRVKVPRSSKLIGVDENGSEIQYQNTSRYYVSRNGVELIKVMPPIKDDGDERRIGVNAGLKCKVVNGITEFDFADVDYGYYIEKSNSMLRDIGIIN